MRITCGGSAIWPSAMIASMRGADRGLGRRVGDEHDRHGAPTCRADPDGRRPPAGAARCSPARSGARPCAWRWRRRRRAGRARTGGCNSRPRGAASARASAAPGRPPAGRRAARATPRAMSTMSATTRRRWRRRRRPGPTSVSSPTASASMVTALVTPIDLRDRPRIFGTMVGWTRCSMPVSVRCATPSSLMR